MPLFCDIFIIIFGIDLALADIVSQNKVTSTLFEYEIYFSR